ncbi:MAG: rfaE bifunctional protein nucleotidyltransferase chain/domain [Pseudohongiellaceae bacterium]|jgi:rfaE bifunctional protein nucleotidyltransferase chain/domain
MNPATPATVVADYHDLAGKLRELRQSGRSIALANGCFDVLHVGHLRLLAEAATTADMLVVALNTDESVTANKGETRPWVPLAERMEVMAAIRGVDYVTSFADSTAGPLLAALQPDVHVKGTDWTAETVPEKDVVEAYGGRVVIAGDPKTHASSDLIERMLGAE